MAGGAGVSSIRGFCGGGTICGVIALRVDWLCRLGQRDPAVLAAGVIPPFFPDWLPNAPEMVQPADDALPGEQPVMRGAADEQRVGVGDVGRDRGQAAADHMPAAPVDDDAADFDPEMTAADYLSLGLAVPSQSAPDTLAGPSHHQSPMLQIHMDGTYEQPRVPTPDVDFAPDNYTQWVADMIGQSSYQPPPDVIGQSSYQPPPDVPYWGISVQHTEPFAHMSAETPPTAYVPRRQVPSESSSSEEHQIRTHVDRGLGRGH
ncbi:hypothetical protein PIB30_024644 [Stylosanthes scabra]|uniref:Uncharacterized protein n=1 Tax=Stylosanthes scabra TaxID=79078 RepID=A0ABU6XBN5_9FABA|nr:hypothetical protein [Stylosanthes scabra]